MKPKPFVLLNHFTEPVAKARENNDLVEDETNLFDRGRNDANISGNLGGLGDLCLVSPAGGYHISTGFRLRNERREMNMAIIIINR